MLKIKEEFDYKGLSRKLEIQLDKLIAENERQQKTFEDEIEKIHLEAQNRIAEAERNFADALEVCLISHSSFKYRVAQPFNFFAGQQFIVTRHYKSWAPLLLFMSSPFVNN